VHSAEFLEDHGCCYETYILGGDFGIGIFVPKQDGINPDLLAMCLAYAVPATDLFVYHLRPHVPLENREELFIHFIIGFTTNHNWVLNEQLTTNL